MAATMARVTITDAADVAQIRSTAEHMAGAGVHVTLGGAAFTGLPKPSPATEGQRVWKA